MSITFRHTAEPVISGWAFECGCHVRSGEEFPTHGDAEQALGRYRSHEARWTFCDDDMCDAYGPMMVPLYVGMEEPVSANFSNRNGMHLLDLLGQDTEDLSGTLAVDEFERALVLAAPTEGIPAVAGVRVAGEYVELPADQVPASADVCAYSGGRDTEYDARAFDALRKIVAQAREWHAESITWG